MLGLKKDTVVLCDHDPAWKTEAEKTVCELRDLLGGLALDIQHVGSTAVSYIKAKPIIDIAVGVKELSSVRDLAKDLLQKGFHLCESACSEKQLLFAAGSFYEGTGDTQTHFIHVVIYGSMEWINYINFRDYLCKNYSAAKEYEALKISLAGNLPEKDARRYYTDGKSKFINYLLRKALVRSYLGKTVTAVVDRPVGYVHEKNGKTIVYPINYGYLPNVIGGDGEELDVYLLGVSEPLESFTAKVIAVVHRSDDVEDKLVAAPEDMRYDQAQIAKLINFQEKYHKSDVEALYQRSCGTVSYTRIKGQLRYLLIQSGENGYVGFPKGHVELDESDVQTAVRETYEETSVKVNVDTGFRREVTYTMSGDKVKTVVYFLGNYNGQRPHHNKGFEHNNYFVLPYEEAYAKLTHRSAKELLKEANEYIIFKKKLHKRRQRRKKD